MKLAELKSLIDKATENAKGVDPIVEVWCGDVMYQITDVSQFRVIPDVAIQIGEVGKIGDADMWLVRR